jgi:hypothetical protein
MDVFVVGKTYRLSFTAGAKATDIKGGMGTLPAAADYTLCFTAM